MSSKFIKPYGEMCSVCGKTVYLEKTCDSKGTVRYSIWCPTVGCPNNSGDYFKTVRGAGRDYQKRQATSRVCPTMIVGTMPKDQEQ